MTVDRFSQNLEHFISEKLHTQSPLQQSIFPFLLSSRPVLSVHSRYCRPTPTSNPCLFPLTVPSSRENNPQSTVQTPQCACVCQPVSRQALVFFRPPISVRRRPPEGVNRVSPLQSASDRQYIQSPSPCPDPPDQEDTVSNALPMCSTLSTPPPPRPKRSLLDFV